MWIKIRKKVQFSETIFWFLEKNSPGTKPLRNKEKGYQLILAFEAIEFYHRLCRVLPLKNDFVVMEFYNSPNAIVVFFIVLWEY